MAPDQTLPNDCDLVLEGLLELQAFDRIPRTGFLQRGVSDAESVCEHSWHVAFLVARLGRFVPDLDRLTAIEIALEHDLAELRTGDLPKPAATLLAPLQKQQIERKVLRDLLAVFAPRAAPADDHDGNGRELRFVKACDRLQLAIKAMAYTDWGYLGARDLIPKRVAQPNGPSMSSSDTALADCTEFEVIDGLLAALHRRRCAARETR